MRAARASASLATTMLDDRLDGLSPEDWHALQVPRVDADVTDTRGLPATYHRTVAARIRQELGGRLHLTYRAPA